MDSQKVIIPANRLYLNPEKAYCVSILKTHIMSFWIHFHSCHSEFISESPIFNMLRVIEILKQVQDDSKQVQSLSWIYFRDDSKQVQSLSWIYFRDDSKHGSEPVPYLIREWQLTCSEHLSFWIYFRISYFQYVVFYRDPETSSGWQQTSSEPVLNLFQGWQ